MQAFDLLFFSLLNLVREDECVYVRGDRTPKKMEGVYKRRGLALPDSLAHGRLVGLGIYPLMDLHRI